MNVSGNGYDGNQQHQLPIELPLLQTHNNSNNNNGQPSAANCFYPSYYTTDPSTPSTATSGAYSSLIHGYNPYSMTPQLEFIFQGYPWHFAAAVDIGSEIPLPSIEQQITAAPLFSHQTLSPLTNNSNSTAAVNVAAAMTRYSRTSQNPRKGGRRPREEYEPPALNEDDREKRDKRRQRNKEAAARCRQRRLDLMSTLQQEKDNLEQKNNQMEQHYSSIRKGLENIVQSLRNHSSSCQNPQDELMQHLDLLQKTLTISASSSAASSSHYHQNGNANNHMIPNGVGGNLPPASQLSSSKRKVENIGGQLEYSRPRPTSLPLGPLGNLNVKDDDSIITPSSSYGDGSDSLLFSPEEKRAKFEPERPTTLSLTQSWGQTPHIGTPSGGLADFGLLKDTLYNNMLNSHTFLTPSVPIATAVNVSLSSALQFSQSDDYQEL